MSETSSSDCQPIWRVIIETTHSHQKLSRILVVSSRFANENGHYDGRLTRERKERKRKEQSVNVMSRSTATFVTWQLDLASCDAWFFSISINTLGLLVLTISKLQKHLKLWKFGINFETSHFFETSKAP